MDADVAGVETVDSAFALTFTFEGKPYIAQRTPIAGRLEMQDPGYEQLFDFTMEVRTAQFSASCRPPQEEDVILIGDNEYRIASATPDQANVVITYALKSNT